MLSYRTLTLLIIFAAARDGLGEAQRVLRVVPRYRAEDPRASVKRLGEGAFESWAKFM